MITVACVWTGDKYGFEYVERLKNMVDRNLKYDRFICLTDNDVECDGIEMIKVGGLVGWWAKLALFNPELRGPGRCIYFDLDTVIVDNLQPILQYTGPFAICANFSQANFKRKNPGLPPSAKYVCKYGSCVMSFGDNFGIEMWDSVVNDKEKIINRCGIHGDQLAIEHVYPNADILQDYCPKDFFCYKAIWKKLNTKPSGSIMIFAGDGCRPHNVKLDWVAKYWK